jgi:hypothetical protein
VLGVFAGKSPILMPNPASPGQWERHHPGFGSSRLKKNPKKFASANQSSNLTQN